jgi:hypothetical protein
MPIHKSLDDRIICYCFDIRMSDYSKDLSLKDFVLAKTKAGLCSCKSKNPSGNCCLKDCSTVRHLTRQDHMLVSNKE